MRLEPMEVYVLDCFRQRGKASLRLSEIVDGCTMTRRNALKKALALMATDQHLIKRTPLADGDLVELTDEGKQYVTLAGDEAQNHRIDH